MTHLGKTGIPVFPNQGEVMDLSLENLRLLYLLGTLAVCFGLLVNDYRKTLQRLKRAEDSLSTFQTVLITMGSALVAQISVDEEPELTHEFKHLAAEVDAPTDMFQRPGPEPKVLVVMPLATARDEAEDVTLDFEGFREEERQAKCN
jgi:hypothetical protein